jgi:transcriptional regulator with XRE-family HTH domain
MQALNWRTKPAMITGEEVEAGRKLLGWSQLKLALGENVNTGTLADIEKGRSRPLRSGSRLQHALETAGARGLSPRRRNKNRPQRFNAGPSSCSRTHPEHALEAPSHTSRKSKRWGRVKNRPLVEFGRPRSS